MSVRLNEDKELVKEIQQRLKENNGYCPCSIIKSQNTKCMCKDFREKIQNGYKGECHCGLYVSV